MQVPITQQQLMTESDQPQARRRLAHGLNKKLARYGPERLSDAELLAMLTRRCRSGTDPIEQAYASLQQFGGIQELLAADARGFCTQTPLGLSSWACLQAARELFRRASLEQLHERDVLGSPARVRDFLGLWLRDRPSEIFAGLFLDNRNRVIAALELFRGTLNQTAVYPREVARQALRLNAAAVIFAHNHPSGIAEASEADRRLTDALKSALAQIDVSVLDHLIIASNRCISFAERGWL